MNANYKTIVAVLITAALAGGIVFIMWLRADIARLEERKDELMTEKSNLQSNVEDLKAENARLQGQVTQK